MTELYELAVRDAVRGLAAGEFTCEALVRSYLDRIEEREPAVGAWQFIDPEQALSAAKALDGRSGKGALAGALVGVKDVIDTVDMPTTYGSAAYQGHRPPYDAACVALARAAGGIVLGKTVSTEFAGMAPGKTRHPDNAAHTPGGSSSGSAAGVAAGMVPLAFGTQTAGSVLRPSSYCGVVGYKPTYGLIDKTGVKTLAASLDTVGIIARDVRDAAFFASVVSGRPGLAVADELPVPRVGLYRSECWSLAQPATVEAIDRAVAALAARGVVVEEIPLMPGYDQLLDIHDGVMGWDMLQGLCFERLFRGDKLAPKTHEMFGLRAGSTPEIYDQAQAKAREARAGLDRLFGKFDVLLTPSAPGEAPDGLDSTGDASFNRGWTMLHVPCVSVPAGRGPGGLPIGVQIVGRIGADAQCLAAAAFLEDALG